MTRLLDLLYALAGLLLLLAAVVAEKGGSQAGPSVAVAGLRLLIYPRSRSKT